MTVRIEKSRNVWNVIHSRTETRNAINPESADALQEAFLEFEKERVLLSPSTETRMGTSVQDWTLNILPRWKEITLWENWTFLRMEIQPEEQLGQVDWNYTNL